MDNSNELVIDESVGAANETVGETVGEAAIVEATNVERASETVGVTAGETVGETVGEAAIV